MSFQKLLTGVLAGAAIGATLGILFAPDKGSATRKKFSRKTYDYTDELEEKFNELIDSITEQFQAVVDEVAQMNETNKQKEANEK
ncbi:MAG: YtxH domain-containing protein [Lentimicrobium sp.]|nr:YtxH domain-containing protein [Lentimicrobium sp.]